MYPKFSQAVTQNSKAFSFLHFGAHPPSSPFPFVKVGSTFSITFCSSLCTAKFVSIASLIVFEPVAQIRISCISGVPGPACTPPPKILPNGSGNLYSFWSPINWNNCLLTAFEADSIVAIVIAYANEPPILE